MALSDALDELEQRWLSRGVRVEDVLLPGLTDTVIRSRTREIAEPHADVVAWYRWHNGCHLDRRPFLAAPSGRILTQLDEAMELRALILELEVETEQAAGDRFGATLLPVATTRDAGSETLSVDLVTGVVFRRDNVPSSEIFLETNLLVTASLEELVRIWCAELDQGSYVWHQNDQVWTYDRTAQPTEYFERNIIH